MKIFYMVAILLAASLSMLLANTNSLILPAPLPEGWENEGNNDEKILIIHRSPDDEQNGVFSLEPITGDPSRISSMIGDIAKGYAMLIRKFPDLSGLDPNFDKGDIKEGMLTGEFIRFNIPSKERSQIVFLVNGGSMLYRGDYIGPNNKWNDVLSMLSGIKYAK